MLTGLAPVEALVLAVIVTVTVVAVDVLTRPKSGLCEVEAEKTAAGTA
jgi:hypothetical protein